MTFAYLDNPLVDKSGWMGNCYRYKHKLCKNKNGKCQCPCHKEKSK